MMGWRPSDIVDAVLAPASIALLVAYHAFLCYKVRTSPLCTIMGINRKARRLWVYDMVIENHKKNVLAVQTLRNSIMESTLMATTAVLLTAGLATFFTYAGTLRELPSEAAGRSAQPVAGTVKSFAVLACFMASFVCHTQSIRFINHVNYMVNVPMSISSTNSANIGNSNCDSNGNGNSNCNSNGNGNGNSNGNGNNGNYFLTADYVADLLERGTILYSLGSRSFYLAFPLLLWVFGSVPMFISSLLLLHALYSSDFVSTSSSSLIKPPPPPPPHALDQLKQQQQQLHRHDHDLAAALHV